MTIKGLQRSDPPSAARRLHVAHRDTGYCGTLASVTDAAFCRQE
jgi:hypothetical protein